MRRIDHCTWAFFARPLELNRLVDDLVRARQRPQESELSEDAGEQPINSWETAWIDVGGEG